MILWTLSQRSPRGVARHHLPSGTFSPGRGLLQEKVALGLLVNRSQVLSSTTLTSGSSTRTTLQFPLSLVAPRNPTLLDRFLPWPFRVCPHPIQLPALPRRFETTIGDSGRTQRTMAVQKNTTFLCPQMQMTTRPRSHTSRLLGESHLRGLVRQLVTTS